MYEFVEFKEAGRRASRFPMVSITKGGMFNLNRSFMENYYKKGKFVTFYWDSKNEVIGLRFSNDEKPNNYKVKATRKGTQGSITGIAYLKFIGFRHDKTRSFEAKLDKESGMILIDIKRKI